MSGNIFLVMIKITHLKIFVQIAEKKIDSEKYFLYNIMNKVTNCRNTPEQVVKAEQPRIIQKSCTQYKQFDDFICLL